MVSKGLIEHINSIKGRIGPTRNTVAEAHIYTKNSRTAKVVNLSVEVFNSLISGVSYKSASLYTFTMEKRKRTDFNLHIATTPPARLQFAGRARLSLGLRACECRRRDASSILIPDSSNTQISGPGP